MIKDAQYYRAKIALEEYLKIKDKNYYILLAIAELKDYLGLR